MQMNELNKNLIDKIISVAYGDSGFIDWIYVHFKAVTSDEVKSLLNEYSKSAKAVHGLKQEDIPEQILEKTKDITGSTNSSESFLSRTAYSLYYFFGKKAIPATVFAILALFIISVFLFRNPTPAHKYSKAEIELAEKQLKQSLAIVGKAFQNAENSFNKEVLKDQINKNLNRGYYLVNNILIGG